MNTFCLIAYSLFLIGLGLIMSLLALIPIYIGLTRLFRATLDRYQSYHYRRGYQAREQELQRNVENIWYRNWRDAEATTAALKQENNQLRKAAYPGKC